MRYKATIAIILSFSSFSAIADGPKILEEVKDKLNLPYIEFAKAWMKTSVVKNLSVPKCFDWGSSNAIYSYEGKNQITRSFTATSENQFDYAFLVFAEYCKANGLTFKHYKTDAYCVDSSDQTHQHNG